MCCQTNLAIIAILPSLYFSPKINYMTFKNSCLLIALALFTSLNAGAQGINFEHGTWDEILAKAGKEGKIVFMDAYTTWCGPCKMMSKSTFTDARVAEFYNKNFICAKIDMEKGEGPALSERYGVQAYPTLLFVNASGALVHKGVGYMEPNGFIALGEKALDPGSQLENLVRQYESGRSDLPFVVKLIGALESANDQRASEIGSKFVSSLTSFDNPDVYPLLRQYVSDPTSPAFAYLVKNKAVIFEGEPEDAVSSSVLDIFMRYFAERNLDMPAMEAVMLKYYPEAKGETLMKFKAFWYAQQEDQEGFLEATSLWLNTYPSDSPDFLNQIAWMFHQLEPGEKYLKNALNWALQAIKLEPGYNNLDTAAWLYSDLGDKKNAKKYAQKAIEAAKKAGEDYTGTRELLDSLK